MSGKKKEGSFRVALLPDKTGVQFIFGDDATEAVTLDAGKLTSLIEKLMFARTGMLPEIPVHTPPTTQSLSVRTDHWAFGQDTPPRDPRDVILSFPHRGYGWIAYRFSAAGAQGLWNDLGAEIRKSLPDSSSAH